MLNLPIESLLAKPVCLPLAAFDLPQADASVLERELLGMELVHQLSAACLEGAAEQGSSDDDLPMLNVLHVKLAQADYSLSAMKKLAAALQKQKFLYVLQAGSQLQLALYEAGQWVASEWRAEADFQLPLQATSLRTLWAAWLSYVGGIPLHAASPVAEQLQEHRDKERACKKIQQLEKRARKEKQPRRQWEMLQEIKDLKQQISAHD